MPFLSPLPHDAMVGFSTSMASPHLWSEQLVGSATGGCVEIERCPPNIGIWENMNYLSSEQTLLGFYKGWNTDPIRYSRLQSAFVPSVLFEFTLICSVLTVVSVNVCVCVTFLNQTRISKNRKYPNLLHKKTHVKCPPLALWTMVTSHNLT